MKRFTTILGLDIGGANIKAALVKLSKDKVSKVDMLTRPFRIWCEGKRLLPQTLRKVFSELPDSSTVQWSVVTMTAELSDVYETKREGVNHILESVCATLSGCHILVVDADARLRSLEYARSHPVVVGGANWAASAWLVSKILEDCVFVDVGSTTTDIVPIRKGRIVNLGRTDLERLVVGELVYTGALRTNVATIVRSLQVRGSKVRVSSELFALSGDVHLILGHIGENEYTSETADGRGVNRAESLARLARVVCADVEMLSESELTDLAGQVYRAQVEDVKTALEQVAVQAVSNLDRDVTVVLSGMGRRFITKMAAEELGFQTIDLSTFLSEQGATSTPALASALMVAERLGVSVKEWLSSSK